MTTQTQALAFSKNPYACIRITIEYCFSVVSNKGIYLYLGSFLPENISHRSYHAHDAFDLMNDAIIEPNSH